MSNSIFFSLLLDGNANIEGGVNDEFGLTSVPLVYLVITVPLFHFKYE